MWPRERRGTDAGDVLFSPRVHAGLIAPTAATRYVVRMIIAYHVIFGAYGFWLPNDPRGSWSTEVWARHLQPFGGATKVDTRQSLARREHDHAIRLEAKRHLQYPAVQFNATQVCIIGDAFGLRHGRLGTGGVCLLNHAGSRASGDGTKSQFGRVCGRVPEAGGHAAVDRRGCSSATALSTGQRPNTESLGRRWLVCVLESARRSARPHSLC